jgi:WD40 repeat protein
MATHPEYPSVVAVGFFNGEIQVYNLREAESLAAVITDKREMHRDEVTVLKWIKDTRTSKKKFLLMSGSKDGKILIWNPQPGKSQLKLTDGFRMLIDYLPNSQFRTRGIEMGGSL